MITIKVTDDDFIPSASLGTQPKWHIGNQWFKQDFDDADQALSEVIVSRILEKSNLAANPLTNEQDFVKYDFAKIVFNNKAYPGCVSQDFKREHEEFIPLENYIAQLTGTSLLLVSSQLARTSKDDPARPIRNFVDIVTQNGLPGYEKFLTAVIELDALILNSDRHTLNLGVLVQDRNLRICPIFDNGQGFFSDIPYNPGADGFRRLKRGVDGMPFYPVDRQKRLCEELYGKQFQTTFSKDDLQKILGEASALYPDKKLQKAELFVTLQMEAYMHDLVIKPPLRSESLSLDELVKPIAPQTGRQAPVKSQDKHTSFPGTRD